MIRVLIILVVVALLLSVLVYMLAYRRVKPNEVWVWQTENGGVRLARSGEMVLAWPMQYKILPLTLMPMPIHLETIQTADKEIVTVTGKVALQFVPEAMAVRQALTQLPALRPEDVLPVAESLVLHGVETAVSTITLSDMRQLSVQTRSQIETGLNQAVKPLGLQVVRFDMNDIR